MIFDRDDTAYIPDLHAIEPPGCAECNEERDEVVDMEATSEWQPGVVVDVWRCPECGHAVLRGGERFVD